MLENSKDFQETLHEVLNVRLNYKTKQERVLQDILKKSDKNFNNDFQEMLKKSIKPLPENEFKKNLEPKDKENDEPVKKVDIREQVKSGASVEEIAKDVDEDSDVDTAKADSNKDTKRDQTLKYMYSVALDEYYILREKLYKFQIQDGDIALDDRNYLKLLQYENYLRKCDTLFKQTNGSYISSQDEDISKKENKYAYDAAKSELKVVNGHQESINEIDRLNKQIENKANEIIEINEAAKSGNVPNYEEKLGLLEKEYISLNAKMHVLKPNILELYRQEQQKNEQENTTTRVVGTMYEKTKEKKVMDADVVRLDKKTVKRNDSLSNDTETEKNELQNTNISLANSYIDSAEAALERKDTKEAALMVSKAKELVGKKQLEAIAGDKKLDFEGVLKTNILSGNEKTVQQNSVSETDAIDTHINNVLNQKINLSDVQKECARAIHTPEERGKNALEREAKAKLEKVKDENLKENDER